MAGDGPFLWLAKNGSPFGYHHLPPGGLCLSAFLFVKRGHEILLGKYADDPRWDTLAGVDASRRRAHAHGWTIPASHLKFGEDPRDAARRVARDILNLGDVRLSEPRVETDVGEPARFPGSGEHYDVWFLVDAEVPEGTEVDAPPWWAALDWHDPDALPADAYARSHEDVVARWRTTRA